MRALVSRYAHLKHPDVVLAKDFHGIGRIEAHLEQSLRQSGQMFVIWKDTWRHKSFHIAAKTDVIGAHDVNLPSHPGRHRGERHPVRRRRADTISIWVGRPTFI